MNKITSLLQVPALSSFNDVKLVLSRSAIALFAPFPYFGQISSIKKSKSSAGFSPLLPLIVIFSNTLRLAYFFWVDYDSSLVYQSFLLLLTSFYLLQVALKYSFTASQKEAPTNSFQFSTLVLLWCVVSLLLVSLYNFEFTPQASIFIGTVIGIVSQTLDALIGVPQVFKNYSSSSAKGLSPMVILIWFVSDIGKTGAYLYFNQPLPFIACASFQSTIDIVLVSQYFYYKKGKGESNPKTLKIE